MNLDHQTGLVVKTCNTSMIDDELLDIINSLGKRCYIHAKRIDHPPGTINKNTTIETLGNLSDSSLVDKCIKHFPKGVKKVLLYDVETSGIDKKNVSKPTYDPKAFDASYYMSMYPDIVAAGYNTPQLAYEHYTRYGVNEGRIGKAPVASKIKPPIVWIYFPDEN